MSEEEVTLDCEPYAIKFIDDRCVVYDNQDAEVTFTLQLCHSFAYQCNDPDLVKVCKLGYEQYKTQVFTKNAFKSICKIIYDKYEKIDKKNAEAIKMLTDEFWQAPRK